MIHIGIYTGEIYYREIDGAPIPKECYIECIPKDLRDAKERAGIRRLMWCPECNGCEEAKKNEDSRRSDREDK